jgi:hypothetical protein
LAQIILGGRRFKGIAHLQGEIIAKELKYTENLKKKYLLQNQQDKFNQTWYKFIILG